MPSFAKMIICKKNKNKIFFLLFSKKYYNKKNFKKITLKKYGKI